MSIIQLERIQTNTGVDFEIRNDPVVILNTIIATSATEGALVSHGGIAINCTNVSNSFYTNGGVTIQKDAYINGSFTQSSGGVFSIEGEDIPRVNVGNDTITLSPDGQVDGMTLDSNGLELFNGPFSSHYQVNILSTDTTQALNVVGGVLFGDNLKVSGGQLVLGKSILDSESVGDESILKFYTNTLGDESELAITIDSDQNIICSQNFSVQGSVDIGNELQVSSELYATSNTSAAISCAGGIYCAENLVVGENVVVTGDLDAPLITTDNLILLGGGNLNITDGNLNIVTPQDFILTSETTGVMHVSSDGELKFIQDNITIKPIQNALEIDSGTLRLYPNENVEDVFFEIHTGSLDPEYLLQGWDSVDEKYKIYSNGAVLHPIKLGVDNTGITLFTSGITFEGEISALDHISATDGISVSGQAIFNDGLNTAFFTLGNAIITQTTSQNISVDTGFLIDGDIQCGRLEIDTTGGSMCVYGDLITSGNTISINNLLTITTSTVQVSNNLQISGSSTLGATFVGGDLIAPGLVTLGSVKVTDLVTDTALIVNSSTIQNLLVTGSIAYQGDLNVDNITTENALFENVTVENTIISQNITTGGLWVSSGEVMIGDTGIIVSGTSGELSFGDYAVIGPETSVFYSTLESTTSPTNGSLVTYGGIGVVKGVTIGEKLIVKSTANSDSSTTGSFTTPGGIGIAKNLHVGGDLVVQGGFLVNGPAAIVYSTEVKLSDNIILLNSGPNGSRDSGILIERFQIENDSAFGDVVNDTEFIQFNLPDQSECLETEIKLPASASSVNGAYSGYYIRVLSGFSSDQCRKITGYMGSTRTATLNSAWTDQNPSINDVVNLYNKSFIGLIYDETLDTFLFSATGLVPDSTFSQTVLLPVKSKSIECNEATMGGLVLLDTVNSSSTTSAALVVHGGLGVVKDVWIGGDLFLNSVNITPNPNEIISSIYATGGNNVSSPTDVDGLVLDSGIWSAELFIVSKVIATTSKYTSFHIRIVAVDNNTDWVYSISSIGDKDSGIEFSVTTNGHIQYTTPDYPGFTSLEFKYRILVNE